MAHRAMYLVGAGVAPCPSPLPTVDPKKACAGAEMSHSATHPSEEPLAATYWPPTAEDGQRATDKTGAAWHCSEAMCLQSAAGSPLIGSGSAMSESSAVELPNRRKQVWSPCSGRDRVARA
jgi:hypothetical protein